MEKTTEPSAGNGAPPVEQTAPDGPPELANAGKLLMQQLHHDVCEAKQALCRAYNEMDAAHCADAVENLIGKFVSLWWLARLVEHKESAMDEKQLEARLVKRSQLVGSIAGILCNNMPQRTVVKETLAKGGGGTIVAMLQDQIDVLQVQLLQMQCELRGAWALLVSQSLCTEATRHDYIDHGTIGLLSHAQAYAGKLVMAKDPGGRLKS